MSLGQPEQTKTNTKKTPKTKIKKNIQKADNKLTKIK